MSIAVLIGNKLGEINFAPATEYEEIMQNLRTILATTKFSVPLDRDFGVDASFVDKPMEQAKAMYIVAIIEAIRQYEPRAEVVQIDWDDDIDGQLIPRVQVNINAT